MKKQCPCCGYYTLDEKEPKYEICPVCYWENDPFQTKHMDEPGANKISLVEAKENYKKFATSDLRMFGNTRAPKLDELG